MPSNSHCRKSASFLPRCLLHRHRRRRRRRHTQFVRLPTFPGLYLLWNLSTQAEMDRCGPKAPIIIIIMAGVHIGRRECEWHDCTSQKKKKKTCLASVDAPELSGVH